MFEESASLFASVYSWFTPTVLFVLLNLMIGTIAIASSFTTGKHQDLQQQHQQNPDPFQLARSPTMLQRLKSINFYSYRSPEPAASFHRPEGLAADTQLHYAFEEHQTTQQRYALHEQMTSHLEEHEQAQLERSPSILQRLKSINLYHYLSPEPNSRNQHLSPIPQKNLFADLCDHSLQDAKEKGNIRDDDLQVGAVGECDQTMEDIHRQLQSGHVERTKSDTMPASGEMPQKLSRKMRKSASTQSAFSHFEEKDMVECRRPATVREGEVSVRADVDDEVDAKADDFINKFKQQLKLQRLDSVMRYKEMIGRGT